MNRLKELRTNRGISARQLADSVGCSHTKISKIERGEQKISTPQAIAIAEYFGVTVDYLLGATAEEMLNTFVDSCKRGFREFSVDNEGRVHGGYDTSTDMALKIGILDNLRDIKNIDNLIRIYDLVSALAGDEIFANKNKRGDNQ